MLRLDSLGVAVLLAAVLRRSDDARRIAAQALSIGDEYVDLTWRGHIELSSALELFVGRNPGQHSAP